MKEKAFKLLQRITSLFETTFRDLGEPPAIALAKQISSSIRGRGAIVVARAAADWNTSAKSSAISKKWSISPNNPSQSWSKSRESLINYSENGAFATRSAKFGGANPST